MCLAVPVKITKVDGFRAEVELDGLTSQISTLLVPDVEVGDYVLLHAGFAIQRLDEKEAVETKRLLDELSKGVKSSEVC